MLDASVHVCWSPLLAYAEYSEKFRAMDMGLHCRSFGGVCAAATTAADAQQVPFLWRCLHLQWSLIFS
jgi:hypothetical protein